MIVISALRDVYVATIEGVYGSVRYILPCGLATQLLPLMTGSAPPIPLDEDLRSPTPLKAPGKLRDRLVHLIDIVRIPDDFK